MRRLAVALALVVWAVSVWAVPVWAHPLDPALLELRQAADGKVEVLWRVPSVQPRGATLRPVLPQACREVEPVALSREGQRVSARWTVDCGPESLVGARVGIEGLRERETDALVRVHLADGRLLQAVLRGDEPYFTLPEREGPAKVFFDYLELGFGHILGGPDHLAFVLGLVLLVVRGSEAGHPVRGRLFWTITAFTAGHSVTLSLATLGWVRVPPAPVEVLIAASILVVATQLAGQPHEDQPWRSPQALAFGFGLLHGLGFAGALAQVGLPSGEIPLALFSFNCGIEVGQLLFVVVLLVAGSLLGRLAMPPVLAKVPAYVIGALASYWIFDRASSLF